MDLQSRTGATPEIPLHKKGFPAVGINSEDKNAFQLPLLYPFICSFINSYIYVIHSFISLTVFNSIFHMIERWNPGLNHTKINKTRSVYSRNCLHLADKKDVYTCQLMWGAKIKVISFSRRSSRPRNQTWSSAVEADSLSSEPPGKLKIKAHSRDAQNVTCAVCSVGLHTQRP